VFEKPAEAGGEKSGGFADPGVNAWAREKIGAPASEQPETLSDVAASQLLGRLSPAQRRRFAVHVFFPIQNSTAQPRYQIRTL